MLYEKIKRLADERWMDGKFDLEWFLDNFDLTVMNSYDSYCLLRDGRLPDAPESQVNTDSYVILNVLGIFFTLEIGEGQKVEGFRAKRYLQEHGVYKEVREHIKGMIRDIKAGQ